MGSAFLIKPREVGFVREKGSEVGTSRRNSDTSYASPAGDAFLIKPREVGFVREKGFEPSQALATGTSTLHV